MCNLERVYWDSSVWIALIKGEVVNGVDRCEVPKLILQDAKDGKVAIFISRLTIVEVHRKKNSSNLSIVQDSNIQTDFLSHRYVKQMDVDKKVALLARDLSWKYGLKPPDAIHAASAIRANAQVIHHWDGDFGKIPPDVMFSDNPLKWTKQTSLL